MRAPRPSNLTACVVLGVLAVVVAMLPPTPPAIVLDAVIVALLATELDRSGRRLALWVVDLASYLVPRERREELAEEWRDYVLTAGEQGLRPVLSSLSIVLCALRLAVRYRLRACAASYVDEVFAGFFDGARATSVLLRGHGPSRPWHRPLAHLVGMLVLIVNMTSLLRARRLRIGTQIAAGASLLAASECSAWLSPLAFLRDWAKVEIALFLLIALLSISSPMTPKDASAVVARIRGQRPGNR